MTFDADSHVEESARRGNIWMKNLPDDDRFRSRLKINPRCWGQNSFYVICEEDDRFTRAAEVDRRRPDHARFRYAAFGESPELVQKFQERSDLSAAIKAKILNDNARQFFSR